MAKKIYLVIAAWNEEVHLYGIFSNPYTAQAVAAQKPQNPPPLVVELEEDVNLGDAGVSAIKVNGQWIITTPQHIQTPKPSGE